ncbi:MAG TPA: PH domain-containing protein [Thermoplasmata archaeon]|nr:PH domain-containing protein [Thermoplasmata archaeon]
MPFCYYCGAAVQPDSQFCPKCGKPVRAPGGAAGPGSATPKSAAPDPYLLAHPPITPRPSNLPFHLQEGEQVYLEIHPHPRTLWKFAFSGIMVTIVIGLFLILPFLALVSTSTPAGDLWWYAAVAIGVDGVFLLVTLVYATLAYRKFRYWVTDLRTVGRRGVVGYSIDSIPLETITDVVIYRGILDRMLGIAVLLIQPFGGGGGPPAPFSGGGGIGGGTNDFQGLRPVEAPEVQQLIFHLRDLRRRATSAPG